MLLIRESRFTIFFNSLLKLNYTNIFVKNKFSTLKLGTNDIFMWNISSLQYMYPICGRYIIYIYITSIDFCFGQNLQEFSDETIKEKVCEMYITLIVKPCCMSFQCIHAFVLLIHLYPYLCIVHLFVLISLNCLYVCNHDFVLSTCLYPCLYIVYSFVSVPFVYDYQVLRTI